MITKNSFTLERLEKLRNENKKIDRVICEKMIYALYLLENLIKYNLDFLFKGGTSLILMIDDPQRFSIDIDITTEIDEDELVKIIGKIIDTTFFSKFEKNERTNSSIPKSHFKFYFKSVIDNRESFVLLDVIFDKHNYPEITNKPITSKWLITEEPIYKVKIPSFESILGDKLTAFAPETSGILYNSGKSMEIIKQLFDIGRLFDFVDVDKVDIISRSFKNTVQKQSEYRDSNWNYLDVINDIINTSLLISFLPPKSTNNSNKLLEIHNGIKRFTTYPIGRKFRDDDAILSAAKAAYLAIKIRESSFSALEKYSKDIIFKEFNFPEEFRRLSKLKKRKPEAFFYWQKVFELF